MYTANQLKGILNVVYEKANALFGASFEFMILYGSYARGDYDKDSDIDIMIVVDLKSDDICKYRSELAKFTSRLGLENDIVVSVIVKDSETFHKYKNDLPFYQNVMREGIRYPLSVR